MGVKIRLSRVGKKHVPFYRIVVVDSHKKRDGAFLANLGTYDALHSAIVQFDAQGYDEWITKGALPTDSAKKIYRLHKKSTKVATKPIKKEPAQKAKKVVKKAEKKEEPTPSEQEKKA